MFGGYFARCLLHETDHLNGIVYTDHLTERQRNLVLQEMTDVMDDVFAERRERARRLEADGLRPRLSAPPDLIRGGHPIPLDPEFRHTDDRLKARTMEKGRN